MPSRSVWLSILAILPLTMAVFLAWPRPVEAQCGSSSSSCKNCHEVKREAPVNQNGAWHTNHAFGDFCVFCHDGNIKAKDAATAHKGSSLQIVDVKGSCLSCHPNDYQVRADKYAAILGKPLGTGGGTSAGTGGDAPQGTGTTAAPASIDPCVAVAPSGGQTIDLAKLYADTQAPPAGNTGNSILLGLITGTVGLLGGLVWYFERPLPRAVSAFRGLLATPVPGAQAHTEAESQVLFADRPELANLLALLKESDPETLRALTHLLADPQEGPRVVKAVSNLDFATLARIGEGDRRALAALLDLADELKS